MSDADPINFYFNRYSLLCGAASFIATFITNVLHPFEVIKIRFQSKQYFKLGHDGKLNHQNLVPKYSSVLSAFRDIYRTEGLNGLYKGFMVSFLTQSIAQSIFFLLYT
jgi:hypothetical protein